MDANGSVEEGGGQDVWVAWAPVNLEGPVGGCWELADDFGGLGVPAEGTVILSTGEEKVGVMFTPGERKNAFLVS